MSNVEVVSYTPDAEKTILRVARVSSDPTNENPGLLRYLIRKGHWSPFEHAMLTLQFTTSRAIAAQMLRHRSFTFQEFSQRYAQVDTAIIYQARRQGETNRQSSVDDLDAETRDWWWDAQREVHAFTFAKYNEALARGIAKESARFVLPLATETILHMSGTLRSWIHYLGDGPGGRTNPDVQQEHRELAEAAKILFVELFPVIAGALEWNN